MRAVTFQAPGEVRVDEVPEPELSGADEAIVRVEASGVCGSDLHIYHGRVAIEPGFVIGHEYVGTVVAAGDGVRSVREGDRVLGTYCTACGECFFCARGDFHKCDHGRVFGHGATLGSLPGAQAELLLVPNADLTLRHVPEGMSDDVALFAGDVMGTGWHAVAETGVEQGSTVAVLGLGPVGLCAVQAALARGAERVIGSTRSPSVSTSPGRSAPRRSTSPRRIPRAAVKAATEGRGVDATIDAVGHPDALELACRITRKAGTVSATGVYAERIEVHMGIVWIKALTLKTGHANVIKHVDPVLEALTAGTLDPTPAGHPPHGPRRGARRLRRLRPPRGAQDRARAVRPSPEITWEQFEAVDMRVGRIVEVSDFPEARVPAWKLEIDFGPEIGTRRSSAQITNYSREELEGSRVVAVVNFPPKRIGPFVSEVLVLGALDDELGVVLLRPDRDAALGDRIA